MEILPEQVAQRGFDHGLTIGWIFQHIDQAIQARNLQRPVHRMPPGDHKVLIHFTPALIEYWKFQYDRGNRPKIPRELWDEIDQILGFPGSRSEPEYGEDPGH